MIRINEENSHTLRNERAHAKGLSQSITLSIAGMGNIQGDSVIPASGTHTPHAIPQSPPATSVPITPTATCDLTQQSGEDHTLIENWNPKKNSGQLLSMQKVGSQMS
jgi:hypothetical protein